MLTFRSEGLFAVGVINSGGSRRNSGHHLYMPEVHYKEDEARLGIVYESLLVLTKNI